MYEAGPVEAPTPPPPPREPEAVVYSPPQDWTEEWKSVYQFVADGMLREASGVSMTTVQRLLIDRIAYNYVDIRKIEANERPATLNERKDLNSRWLSMTQEFNRMLADNEDKRRDQLVADVQAMCLDALKRISSDDDKKILRLALSEGFAKLNL